MSHKKGITYDQLVTMLKEYTYDSPDGWQNIEYELDINDRLNDLKTYNAPDDLWQRIEVALPQHLPVANEAKGGRIIFIWSLIGVLIFYTGLSILCSVPSSGEAVSYHSETIDIAEFPSADNEMEPENRHSLETAIKFIDDNTFMYGAKQKLDYEKQLEELEAAAAAIKAMHLKFGEDKQSLKRLAKIEREKAALIKSMIKGA